MRKPLSGNKPDPGSIHKLLDDIRGFYQIERDDGLNSMEDQHDITILIREELNKMIRTEVISMLQNIVLKEGVYPT